MIEFIAMIGKLLWLYVRKGKLAIENHLTGVGSVVPSKPAKPRPAPPMPQTKEPRHQVNKWRLTPDKHGTYNLEKWNSEIEMYTHKKGQIKCEEEAQLYIRMLERPTIDLKDK